MIPYTERPLPGDSIALNRRYLDSILIEGRIVGAKHPDTRFSLFGKDFETPIMTAALSHLQSGMDAFALGAKLAGAPCCVGMGSVEELRKVLRAGDGVIRIIKPYADRDEIFRRLECAREEGALAVGMDVEHSVNVRDDRDSLVAGFQMKLPTLEELREYVSFAALPFLVKGALSVRDASVCADLGCAGVILSHHNGLMRWAVPPVLLLPELRKRFGGKLLLVADGGIADGFDAYKALALGADAVSVGRPLMEPLQEGGPEGMAAVLRAMNDELKAVMVRTGAATLRDIDPSTLHFMGGLL